MVSLPAGRQVVSKTPIFGEPGPRISDPVNAKSGSEIAGYNSNVRLPSLQHANKFQLLCSRVGNLLLSIAGSEMRDKGSLTK